MSDIRTRLIRLAASYPSASGERQALLSLVEQEAPRQKQALLLDSNAAIIPVLNGLLRREMTVVNQYMVQHALCENWGYTKLAGILKMQAVCEMKHAEKLIERVIYLESIPEVGQLNEVHVGADVESQLRNNWAAEREAVGLYNKAIALCVQQGDSGTRTLLESILADEEKHLDEDQSRIEQIRTLGIEKFLAEMI